MSYKLKIEGVSKTFGDFVALEKTDLEMREGEFLTLLGPSGSGKTTLLMMVAGLTTPDTGAIWIDGKLATFAAPYDRDIGMMFQNYALFPHLSVYDNIAFPLRMRRIAEAEIGREVGRVLEIVQLPHLANRFPRQLSGGQQQRIALARCIVYRPSIILMDEPLGALDKKLRDQLQIEIKRLHKQLGTTILYVSHDQQETLTMSDRICLMNHGRIEQLGTPQQLYFQPRTLFAADFLGESNLLPVEVAEDSGSQIRLRSQALGGAEFLAARRDEVPTPGRVMIRPERLFFADATVNGAANCVAGTVDDVIFTGGITKYFVGIEGGSKLVLSAPTGHGVNAVETGARVHLTWTPESAVVLPDAPRSAS